MIKKTVVLCTSYNRKDRWKKIFDLDQFTISEKVISSLSLLPEAVRVAQADMVFIDTTTVDVDGPPVNRESKILKTIYNVQNNGQSKELRFIIYVPKTDPRKDFFVQEIIKYGVYDILTETELAISKLKEQFSGKKTIKNVDQLLDVTESLLKTDSKPVIEEEDVERESKKKRGFFSKIKKDKNNQVNPPSENDNRSNPTVDYEDDIKLKLLLYEEQIAQMEEDLKTERSRSTTLSEQLKKVREDISNNRVLQEENPSQRYIKEKEESKREISRLQNKLRELAEAYNNVVEAFNKKEPSGDREWQQKYDQLERSFALRQAEIDKLAEQIDEKNTLIEELKEATRSATNNETINEVEHKELLTKLEITSQRNNDLKQEISDSKKQYDRLLTDFSELKANFELGNPRDLESIRNLQSELTKAEEESKRRLREYNETRQQMQNQILELESTGKADKSRIITLSSDLEQITSKKNQLESENDKKESTIQELRKSVIENESKVRDLEAQKEGLTRIITKNENYEKKNKDLIYNILRAIGIDLEISSQDESVSEAVAKELALNSIPGIPELKNESEQLISEIVSSVNESEKVTINPDCNEELAAEKKVNKRVLHQEEIPDENPQFQRFDAESSITEDRDADSESENKAEPIANPSPFKKFDAESFIKEDSKVAEEQEHSPDLDVGRSGKDNQVAKEVSGAKDDINDSKSKLFSPPLNENEIREAAERFMSNSDSSVLEGLQEESVEIEEPITAEGKTESTGTKKSEKGMVGFFKKKEKSKQDENKSKNLTYVKRFLLAAGVLLSLVSGGLLAFKSFASEIPTYEELLDDNNYVDAGKHYPEKIANTSDELFKKAVAGDENALTQLLTFNRDYKTPKGEFDTHFLTNDYERATEAYENSPDSFKEDKERLTLVAYSFLKTRRLEEAEDIQSVIKDPDIDELIATYNDIEKRCKEIEAERDAADPKDEDAIFALEKRLEDTEKEFQAL